MKNSRYFMEIFIFFQCMVFNLSISAMDTGFDSDPVALIGKKSKITPFTVTSIFSENVFIGETAQNEHGLKELVNRLPQLVDNITLSWKAGDDGVHYGNYILDHSEPQCWSSSAAFYRLLREENLLSFDDFNFYPVSLYLGTGWHVVLKIENKWNEKTWFLDATTGQYHLPGTAKIMLADINDLQEFYSKMGFNRNQVREFFGHAREMRPSIYLTINEWFLDNCNDFLNYMRLAFNVTYNGLTALQESNASIE